MKSVTVIFCLALLLFSCGEDPRDSLSYDDRGMREVAAQDLELRDSLQYVRGEDSPFTGVAVEFYESGAEKVRADVVEGVYHGRTVSFYEEGGVELEGTMKNGEIHGEVVVYFEEGYVRDRLLYEQGELVDR
ncbi:toxin-antitoxin system YwqK family antitoxin [Chitinivibrio alkaliphilus]|uniref:MORN repeat-containing protein n=1 Tax=Chitinivibrio alkaliphilus ACht1 TaxID=1313304 RepID=U7D7V0_9BACT|nr:hypothetical protein [Chitinivibrio alkaliphilus]ERP39030.1 hypothetical protein CALK_0523 [Chitinivibrio alkaliphilus ACht1]